MDLPSESQIRWILARTSALLAVGAEPVRGLVTPTGDFFPDRFDGTPASVAALMTRVQANAGLQDLEVDLSIVVPTEDGRSAKVSCSSGACGATPVDTKLDRYAKTGEGTYAVTMAAGEVRDPVVLVATAVRAVSFMFLSEVGGYDDLLPNEREAATDLAAVMLGFGVLVANGSHIYKKGCGGVSVLSATKMPVDELGLALGIFCVLFDVPGRAASKHLELTPGEAFEEGHTWARSNEKLVRRLKSDPEGIAAGDFSLAPARSWLARVLGVGKPKGPQSSAESLDELERALATSAVVKSPRDPKKAQRLAELRALVDESLEQ